jgi:hypothetical protein
MRQEEQMLDRQQERNKAAAEPVENARFLNMRKLVWEFNRMHRRFNQVEDMAKRLRIESKVRPQAHIHVEVCVCASVHASIFGVRCMHPSCRALADSHRDFVGIINVCCENGARCPQAL